MAKDVKQQRQSFVCHSSAFNLHLSTGAILTQPKIQLLAVTPENHLGKTWRQANELRFASGQTLVSVVQAGGLAGRRLIAAGVLEKTGQL
ncbi:MAG: hypothetical protein IPI16_13425 [Comamonadaceae bacterium]|nr:hypothetical protein [Comamonadaceae bacterium]